MPVRGRGHGLDDGGGAQHAGLGRVHADIAGHRVDLRGHHVGGDRMHAGYAQRVLRGDRGDGAHAEAAQRGESLQVGLDAGAAAGVGAGDGQGAGWRWDHL
ncbi:hypothetical protein D3C81_1136920 [compost metagenome]